MRRFGRVLGRVLLTGAVLGAGLWGFGPYEPVELEASFEPRRFGEGVDVYFETIESRYDDIIPGTEKRVIWAGQKETRTPVSVVYLHGFSATSEEIRPVPDRVAEALGANLVYTRLAGHGRSGAAMAEPTVQDWMQDVAEALAAGRHIGDKVVVIATSTGATLAVAAALDPELAQNMDALVMVSPNFGINNPLAPLLTLPGARYWLPPLAGRDRSFPARNEDHAKFWTNAYPSVAVLPMAALVDRVAKMDVSKANVPSLFWYSEDDVVVRPDLTNTVAEAWGGPVSVQKVVMTIEDDPNAHVVAGDIMSPSQTGFAVAEILSWLNTQGIE